MSTRRHITLAYAGLLLARAGLLSGAAPLPARGATLTVGEGRQFATIEAANAAANPGDTIEVYAAAGDGVYRRPAVYVAKAGLRFIGQGGDSTRIVLDGDGFDYSGVGSTPRAIFQVNAAADDVLIEGFELRNAKNASHNAAGVRINQASRATVRRCEIHHNQMGIMSNGAAGNPTSASGQLIEFCIIHTNGEPDEPGYNHNLYLGGTSVTLRFCEVRDALTGHNVKSRAHFNLFAYNFVRDSANREFDLVDAWDTARPHAHAVLLGNFIVKRDPLSGNSNVIHFGQDGGGGHDGTLHLLHNTIVTPHYGAVVFLSAAGSRAELVNNVIFNDRQNGPRLYELANIPDASVITGDHNWLSKGYDASATGLDPATTYHGAQLGSDPGFVDRAARDWRLRRAAAGNWPPNGLPAFADGDGATHSGVPAFQYRAIAERLERAGSRAGYVGAGIDLWPAAAGREP
ncbi:MAG: hypothetical protein CHACPFDD_03394 [Phycisphaerae bacterium]|nr:hypothetical protein [Phycisphaerae bacterium]